jgi:hypothetical protein
MKINWVDGSYIKTEFVDNSFMISANKEGLISLANILTDMAKDETFNGWHIHLDDWNDLEKGSIELTLMKDQDLPAKIVDK